MGWNSATYWQGSGGDGHDRKVTENKGTNFGAEQFVTGGQAQSEATGEDPGVPDLCI